MTILTSWLNPNEGGNRHELIVSWVTKVCFVCLFFSVLSLNNFCASESFNGIRNVKIKYILQQDKLHISWSDTDSLRRSSVAIYDQDNKKIAKTKRLRPEAGFDANLFKDTATYTLHINPVDGNISKQESYKKKFVFSTKVKTPSIFGELSSRNSGGRSGTYFLPENNRLQKLPVMLLFHGSSIAGKNVALIFKKLVGQVAHRQC